LKCIKRKKKKYRKRLHLAHSFSTCTLPIAGSELGANNGGLIQRLQRSDYSLKKEELNKEECGTIAGTPLGIGRIGICYHHHALT
jgi:hypothetical protein